MTTYITLLNKGYYVIIIDNLSNSGEFVIESVKNPFFLLSK